MARQMKDSGIEWIGEIPEDWKTSRVKYCFKRKNSKAKIKGPVVLSLARSGVKVRDISNNEGQLAESYYDYNPVEKGDLLLNPMDLYSGANCSYSTVEGVISPAYINLRNIEGSANAKFYDYYFKVQYWMMVLFSFGKGVSFDNRWTLGQETLMNFPLVYPSLQEQEKIAGFLDKLCVEIDNVLEKTRASIDEYKQLKQSVITQVVTKGIRPNRPMKDSGIEWIGEIPEDWRIKRLRYIGNCQNGISKGAEAFGSGYPFISYSNVYRNFVLPKIATEFIETTKEERELYSVQVGDVFFTRTSETIEEIGFSSVCEKTIPNATFAGFLIRFRPYNTKEIIPKYSKYYFRANIHRAFFVKEMNLVTRASLGQGLLKRLPVILPNIQEQEEIADYLDIKCAEIDKLIEKKEQLVTELETYKKSLIYEYVTGKKEVY